MPAASYNHADMALTDGEGEGFGNKISIQTVAIVKAAKAVGKVYKVDDGKPVGSMPAAVWSHKVM